MNFISKAWAKRDFIPPEPPPADLCENINYDELTLQHSVCIFNRFYNAAILSVGAVFIIWMIVSGIRYMTAGDNEESVASAKSSLTYAILGFVLVLAAYAIIALIGTYLGTGFDLPIFTLPASTR